MCAVGMYVRQCVLEYKKLTFSQLMRFHAGLLDYFSKDEEGNYHDQPEHTDSQVLKFTLLCGTCMLKRFTRKRGQHRCNHLVMTFAMFGHLCLCELKLQTLVFVVVTSGWLTSTR